MRLCGWKSGQIYTYAISRKNMPPIVLPSTLIAFSLALRSKNATVRRTDPVAVLRLKISVMPRRAAFDLPWTVCACYLPAIPSPSESWGWEAKLRYCAYHGSRR